MCKFQAADAAVMPAAGKARMAYSLAHAAPETAPADALAAPGAGPVMAAGPTVARIRLGAALRRMRAAARLDQEPAARALGATQPKIARIEGGMSAVRTQDVAALLGLYDVTDAALREEMLGLADLSREDGWWAPLSRDLTVANRHLLDLEAEASQIRVYDSQAIPALLQTDAYARAAASALAPDDRRWADRRGRGGLGTAALARRRGLLRLPDPPQVWALIQQAVLTRCPAANPAVLTGQLTELADLAAGSGSRRATTATTTSSRSADQPWQARGDSERPIRRGSMTTCSAGPTTPESSGGPATSSWPPSRACARTSGPTAGSWPARSATWRARA